ncbi:hypothetical protein EI94DRAFT_1819015 [Lactarius quietus]|nr:hypothetical protein EI94DRAFT_1819015 [Lactarius quietus]
MKRSSVLNIRATSYVSSASNLRDSSSSSSVNRTSGGSSAFTGNANRTFIGLVTPLAMTRDPHVTLPLLAMMFRGASGNNYCTEILHFILNLKHVWTPEFVDIMRNNMLVNLLGLTGHALPIYLNIEHLIGELKGLLQAKGLQSTWDHLRNISAALDILKKLKKQVATSMKTAYQGMTHKAPKTDHLVWQVVVFPPNADPTWI